MLEDNQPQQMPTQEPAQPATATEQTNQPQQPAETSTPTQPNQPAKPVQPAKAAAKQVKTSQDEKMWAAIGYIAFLGLVTIAIKPKSEFCKKHASQGLVLFVVWFVGLILLAIGSFLSVIGGILMLGATILAIIGIMKAISSYEFKVPVLSDIAKAVPTNAIVGTMTGKKPATPAQPQQPGTPATPAQPQQPGTPATPAQPQQPTAAQPPAKEEQAQDQKQPPNEPTPPTQPQQ